MSTAKIICWDCENVINTELPEEIKMNTPRDIEGNLLIICEKCSKDEDE